MEFDAIEADTILAGRSEWIGPEHAAALAEYPLESIETEFPHFARELDSPDGVARPQEQHPVFYGCYDWHSAVHSHWGLVRQLRLVDDHPNETEIVRSIDARLTPANVETEIEYFDDNPAFEKPYGWAWLLHLTAELSIWDHDRASEWRATLAPLEETIVDLVETEFLTQDRPFRVGTHQNSAFALSCILDYARTTGRDALATATVETALEFFADDRDYPVEYEPLGWDFLSPALTEADLMRRVYDRAKFRTWLDRFLPDITAAPYDAILGPAEVEPRPDEGVALHLVGLNVSKAWAMAGIADHLDDHPYAAVLERSATRHAERGLAQAFTDDYAGAHWLSSFVLYLLTRTEAGIAPPRSG